MDEGRSRFAARASVGVSVAEGWEHPAVTTTTFAIVCMKRRLGLHGNMRAIAINSGSWPPYDVGLGAANPVAD